MLMKLWLPIFVAGFGIGTIVCEEMRPADGRPEIIVREGKPRLVLPQGVIARIRAGHPGYRVPGDADISGEWAVFKEPGRLPFVTWADYDGNGLTDIMLFLLGKGRWRLAVFEQGPSGRYRSETLFDLPIGEIHGDYEPPQRYYLETLRRGEKYETTTVSRETVSRQFDVDAIMLILVETSMTFFHKDKSGYVETGLPSQ